MAIFVNDREVFVIHFDEIFKADLVIGINDLFFQTKAEMAAWQANYEKPVDDPLDLSCINFPRIYLLSYFYI